jgi:hypothetical protein
MGRSIGWNRKKTEVLCHSWCGTIKISPCSKAINAEHRPFHGNDGISVIIDERFSQGMLKQESINVPQWTCFINTETSPITTRGLLRANATHDLHFKVIAKILVTLTSQFNRFGKRAITSFVNILVWLGHKGFKCLAYRQLSAKFMVLTTILFTNTTFLWATCCLICFITIVKPFLTLILTTVHESLSKSVDFLGAEK